MERERKRKRALAAGGSRRRTEEIEDKGKDKVDVLSPAPPPSEDEVEEFFAILRRMHVAVKYFEKSNVGLDGRELTERLETEVLPVVDVEEEDDVKEVEKVNVSANWDLDLNRIPEGESSSV